MSLGVEVSPYRLFDTSVSRVEQISSMFRRVTLHAESLRLFAPWGLDQRIKIVLPRPNPAAEGGSWGGPLAGDVDGLPVSEWRSLVLGLPIETRHPLRTYTPRSIRPDDHEIDIDFFVHEPAGPASRWAVGARPGDRLLISGPDVRADDRQHGIQWRPRVPPRRVLLAGDEAAQPAMSAILASLPSDAIGAVFFETDSMTSCPPFDAAPPSIQVSVVLRRDRRPGDALHRAIDEWLAGGAGAASASEADFAAWVATESTAVARIKTELLHAGIDPEALSAQGYWREGPRRH
ncbi:siderophore-interacting protein [Frigoribacterium sp. 2-23]|uniref:siderophore-interacting protein n=1 Tax=Frigoribacterium sp. 2-23 TaxID=3415006 RepID=UPI003C6EEA2E